MSCRPGATKCSASSQTGLSVEGRPLLAWNHDRMMAGCLEGLRARLAG